MRDHKCQLIIQITGKERDFLLETANKMELSVADLIVLSVLALRQPISKQQEKSFDVGIRQKMNNHC